MPNQVRSECDPAGERDATEYEHNAQEFQLPEHRVLSPRLLAQNLALFAGLPVQFRNIALSLESHNLVAEFTD
ncbi:MAG TPA: hypothetical protein VN673_12035 [Clostridia bacterium]|nr:hypothetical protein [Clostridia bacterium]